MENNYPGINKQLFTLYFSEDYFKEDLEFKARITKVHYNWWRKILVKLGFTVKLFICIKVEN